MTPDNRFAMVEILWWDHWGEPKTYLSPDEVASHVADGLFPMSSIGYLVGETDSQYVLSDTLSYWNDGDDDVRLVCGLRGIGKCDVVDVKVLA